MPDPCGCCRKYQEDGCSRSSGYRYRGSLRHDTRLRNQANLHEAAVLLQETRPTAVNLAWAVQRILKKAAALEGEEPARIQKELESEANKMFQEDIEVNKKIGAWGAELIEDGSTILTHCNAGALATAGYGTALGVIRSAFVQGKNIRVFADETRPFLQGSRLTVWELQKKESP